MEKRVADEFLPADRLKTGFDVLPENRSGHSTFFADHDGEFSCEPLFREFLLPA
jgi:hypothetical protein